MNTSHYILSADSLTLCYEGEIYTITKESAEHLWSSLLDHVNEGQWESVVALIDRVRALRTYVEGDIKIYERTLWYRDTQIDNSLTQRIVDMHAQGLPITPMIKFMQNLMSNPSYRAINELYGFLDNNGLPITTDGHFVAFKRVTDTFLDTHTRSIDNHPGVVVEMPRNMVDEDKHRTCSAGLHFASAGYLRNFTGEKLVTLKINPRDVVSIPTDYNNTKGRCCRYQVIEELPLEDLFSDKLDAWSGAVISDPAYGEKPVLGYPDHVV
jgi:preprotein translocase subunit Sec61beta